VRLVASCNEDGGEMNHDDRKELEDRIYDYGTAVRDRSGRMTEKAWDRVSRVLTKIQTKGEKDE